MNLASGYDATTDSASIERIHVGVLLTPCGSNQPCIDSQEQHRQKRYPVPQQCREPVSGNHSKAIDHWAQVEQSLGDKGCHDNHRSYAEFFQRRLLLEPHLGWTRRDRVVVPAFYNAIDGIHRRYTASRQLAQLFDEQVQANAMTVGVGVNSLEMSSRFLMDVSADLAIGLPPSFDQTHLYFLLRDISRLRRPIQL